MAKHQVLALFSRMDIPSIMMWEVSCRRNFQREYEESGFGHITSIPEALGGCVQAAVGPRGLKFNEGIQVGDSHNRGCVGPGKAVGDFRRDIFYVVVVH